MATDSAFTDVLSSFTAVTESALQALPDATSLLPPTNGITLLDAKNEIFLAYLQALALRNLSVIRSIKTASDTENAQKLSNDITKKLVEHRVYLERGVRPLEQKIKYQVDRVIKAADDDERAQNQKMKAATKVNGHATKDNGEDGSEDADEDEDSDASADEDSTVMAHPNAAAFTSSTPEDTSSGRYSKSKGDGVYRPPRVSATSMPTTEQREKKERGSARSRTVDEYISHELSTAPLAEPSIGSTISAGGRQTKNARQLAQEAERREYEEVNLVRLPKESKKEQGRKRGGKEGGFGGEEWRDLTASVDRIGDLTRRKGKGGALEKSRKRRAVEDSPRDAGIGGAFDVKQKRLMKKMKR